MRSVHMCWPRCLKTSTKQITRPISSNVPFLSRIQHLMAAIRKYRLPKNIEDAALEYIKGSKIRINECANYYVVTL